MKLLVLSSFVAILVHTIASTPTEQTIRQIFIPKTGNVSCDRVIRTYQATSEAILKLKEAEFQLGYATFKPEPAKSELIRDAEDSVGKVEDLIAEAQALNFYDPKFLRKWFIDRRLYYIGTVANAIREKTNTGLKPHPVFERLSKLWASTSPNEGAEMDGLPMAQKTIIRVLWKLQSAVDKKLRSLVDNQCRVD